MAGLTPETGMNQSTRAEQQTARTGAAECMVSTFCGWGRKPEFGDRYIYEEYKGKREGIRGRRARASSTLVVNQPEFPLLDQVMIQNLDRFVVIRKHGVI